MAPKGAFPFVDNKSVWDYNTHMIRYQAKSMYTKTMNRTPKVSMQIPSEDLWAASWQAYVQNGNQYVKPFDCSIDPNATGQKTNKMIVQELLADPTQITQESRGQGETVRRYFMGLTFKMIEGKSLTPFMQGAYDAACKNTITSNFDFGVIVSLPSTYEKATSRDIVDRRIRFAQGGYLGTIGDKVACEIEVLKRLWSEKWNTWYITGITDSDQVLFFAHKTNIEIGARVKITGTVKGTRDNSTQLNRVKVI